MKRLILTLSIALLALPTAAFGKGPSEAVVTGPGDGGGGGITFKGCCEPGTPTMQLAEAAGFFPGAFAQEPSPMLAERPKGDLGPKYTVVYTVPDGEGAPAKIAQDLYPYAKPLPVTYMPPGQPIFDGQTSGGWYPATSQLKETLVAAGLPATPPAASRAAEPSDGHSFPTAIVVLVGGLLVLAAAAFLLRRKLRPAARMAGSPN